MSFETLSEQRRIVAYLRWPERAGKRAAVTMNFNALASGLTDLSEQQWVPQKGWVYVGGVQAVIMGQGGRRGVFAESSQVSIDEVFAALEESAGI